MPRAFDASTNPPPKTLSTAEVQSLNIRIRNYRAAYLRYWMRDTAAHPGNRTGRPVDAVVMPVAPCPAARIVGGVRWPGYAAPVVLNDHSAAVLPVIRADKDVDVRGPPPAGGGKYAGVSKLVYDDCELTTCLSGAEYKKPVLVHCDADIRGQMIPRFTTACLSMFRLSADDFRRRRSWLSQSM